MVTYRNIIIFLVIAIATTFIADAAPSPGNMVGYEGATTTRNDTATAADSFIGEGGNVTKYNLSQKVQTNNWALLWGDVSGQFVLEAPIATNNNSNLHIFNWSKLSRNLTGFIFFSNDSNADWTDLSASDSDDCKSEDVFLSHSAVDNVTETYIAGQHPEIQVDSDVTPVIADSSVQANTTSLNGPQWQGVLIESSSGTKGRIYTAIIQDAALNYADEQADYQILVPVDALSKERTYYVFASVE